MTPEERQALKEKVDAAKRLTVEVPTVRQHKWREAARRKRERVKNGEVVVTVHNRTGYQNGCKCDICRAAHTAYTKKRYWEKKGRAA